MMGRLTARMHRRLGKEGERGRINVKKCVRRGYLVHHRRGLLPEEKTRAEGVIRRA